MSDRVYLYGNGILEVIHWILSLCSQKLFLLLLFYFRCAKNHYWCGTYTIYNINRFRFFKWHFFLINTGKPFCSMLCLTYFSVYAYGTMLNPDNDCFYYCLWKERRKELQIHSPGSTFINSAGDRQLFLSYVLPQESLVSQAHLTPHHTLARNQIVPHGHFATRLLSW